MLDGLRLQTCHSLVSLCHVKIFIFYWMMCILCEESCWNTVESLIVVILVILHFEIEYECCATMFFWGANFTFFQHEIMSSTHAKDFCERSVPIHCHPSLRGLRLLHKFPHYDLHFTEDLIVKSRQHFCICINPKLTLKAPQIVCWIIS